MTKLYGFTKDSTFSYFCFGKKCYLFKIKYSKLFKKFHKYFACMSSDDVLVWIMNNSNPICFYGIVKTNREAFYDIFYE